MNDFWQGRSVLITGAGGFIGSHLVETLVSRGAKVRAFLHYNSNCRKGALGYLSKDVQDAVEIVNGDLRDITSIPKAMKGISHVFHLGALVGIPYSYDHPEEVFETNILGTFNILQVARDIGIERVIHTSTSEVYGTPEKVPVSEEAPLRGQSPYSASKISADKIAESFYYSYSFPVVTIRPFNTYGPHQSSRAVIPTIITQSIKSGHVLIGNLSTKRDFTFVQDTVAGFIKGGEIGGIEGHVINLGTGQSISIGDLITKVSLLLGKRVDITVEDERLRPEKSEVKYLLSDNSKARKLLDWLPAIDLDCGLSKTIDWTCRHMQEYDPDIYQR